MHKGAGGAVEVGILELLPDLVQEVTIAGRAAFVICKVELANDASFAVRRVPHEGARVPLGREGFASRVVDAELDGLNAVNDTRPA